MPCTIYVYNALRGGTRCEPSTAVAALWPAGFTGRILSPRVVDVVRREAARPQRDLVTRAVQIRRRRRRCLSLRRRRR